MTRHLPEFGWTPLVLTAREAAYPERDPASADALPTGLQVGRGIALDSARHLAVAGRYPRWLALPDRWVSWWPGAVATGLRMIRRHRPQVIWTTYPLATAHVIGATLQRLTGLPWIADFRDPMVELIDETWYPTDPAVRRARLFVERRVAARATAATFCTATARDIFTERHGWPTGNCAIIANGYDEMEFEAAAQLPSKREPGGVHLVHSGTLYPGPDRDPDQPTHCRGHPSHARGPSKPIAHHAKGNRIRRHLPTRHREAGALRGRRPRAGARPPRSAPRGHGCRRPAAVPGAYLESSDPRQGLRVPAGRPADSRVGRRRRRDSCTAPSVWRRQFCAHRPAPSHRTYPGRLSRWSRRRPAAGPGSRSSSRLSRRHRVAEAAALMEHILASPAKRFA